MARAHRVYLAYPTFRRRRRRRSSRPIASSSSNRISTTAVAAMPVAMYIAGPFLLRSIALLRHQGRRGRCAHDDRVQSAPVGCPSRVGPPVKLITTQRSDCRLPTLDSQLRLSRIILSYHSFNFVSLISICHLSRTDQYCTPGPPSYSFIRYFLLKIIIVRPCIHVYYKLAHKLSFLRRYYSSYQYTSTKFSQSVSFNFFFASSHRAPALFSSHGNQAK